MKQINSFEQLNQIINSEKFFLLYVFSDNCSVCHADFPKVLKIVEKENLESYKLDAMKVRKAVGQLSLFSVPVILIFWEGKEIRRQAKIIDFEELEKRILQVKKSI